VRQAADPEGRGRQYLASQLEKLVGTRMAGFVLTRQAPAGKWGVATYALRKTDAPRVTDAPYAPYAPYADGSRRDYPGDGVTTSPSKPWEAEL
jgi:hypothetical protein